MMDTLGLVLFGVIAYLSGATTLLSALFYIKKSQFFEELADNFLESLANSEEKQKILYQIGGIIGQGVKGGFGIGDLNPRSRGGKFKWGDLVADIAGQYFQNKLANPSPPLQSPTPSTTIAINSKDAINW